MRILMVGAAVHHMLPEAQASVPVENLEWVRMTAGEIQLKDGSVIVCRGLRREEDVERFRGLRFDMVVEHPSYRGPRHLLDMVRAMVLRPK